MTQVNHDVAEENIRLGEGDAKKQIPMVQTTLRKQLFFSPDNLIWPEIQQTYLLLCMPVSLFLGDI